MTCTLYWQSTTFLFSDNRNPFNNIWNLTHWHNYSTWHSMLHYTKYPLYQQ